MKNKDDMLISHEYEVIVNRLKEIVQKCDNAETLAFGINDQTLSNQLSLISIQLNSTIATYKRKWLEGDTPKTCINCLCYNEEVGYCIPALGKCTPIASIGNPKTYGCIEWRKKEDSHE